LGELELLKKRLLGRMLKAGKEDRGGGHEVGGEETSEKVPYVFDQVQWLPRDAVVVLVVIHPVSACVIV
jgi:hypothetical protein